MKSNQLEIITHKVDWLKVIKMAFKKKDWGKEFTLYTHKDVTITSTMQSFNFTRNVATFKIDCVHTLGEEISGNYTFIEYYMNSSTLEQFKKLLIKKVVSLLEDIDDSNWKDIAEKNLEITNTYSWRISESHIISLGYKPDLDKINKLSPKYVKQGALKALKEKVCDELDRVNEGKINTYLDNNKVETSLIELKKELE